MDRDMWGVYTKSGSLVKNFDGSPLVFPSKKAALENCHGICKVKKVHVEIKAPQKKKKDVFEHSKKCLDRKDIYASVLLYENRIIGWKVGPSPRRNPYEWRLPLDWKLDGKKLESISIKLEQGPDASNYVVFNDLANRFFSLFKLHPTLRYGNPPPRHSYDKE